MFKIIPVDGMFTYKELDENGNSVRVGAERFESEEAVQAFLDGGVPDAPEPSEDSVQTDQTEPDRNPEPLGDSENGPEDGSAPGPNPENVQEPSEGGDDAPEAPEAPESDGPSEDEPESNPSEE